MFMVSRSIHMKKGVAEISFRVLKDWQITGVLTKVIRGKDVFLDLHSLAFLDI